MEDQSEDSETEDEMGDETSEEREDDRYHSADDDENQENREKSETSEESKDSKIENGSGMDGARAIEDMGKGNKNAEKDKTTMTHKNGTGTENQEKQKPEKVDKKKDTKKSANENSTRKNPLDKQNGNKQPPQKQDRGRDPERDQEKMYKYVNRQDRSVSKRRASKSPSSTSQERKLKRVDSYSHGRGRGNFPKNEPVVENNRENNICVAMEGIMILLL